jgi:hypothetical protein
LQWRCMLRGHIRETNTLLMAESHDFPVRDAWDCRFGSTSAPRPPIPPGGGVGRARQGHHCRSWVYAKASHLMRRPSAGSHTKQRKCLLADGPASRTSTQQRRKATRPSHLRRATSSLDGFQVAICWDGASCLCPKSLVGFRLRNLDPEVRLAQGPLVIPCLLTLRSL